MTVIPDADTLLRAATQTIHLLRHRNRILMDENARLRRKLDRAILDTKKAPPDEPLSEER